MLNVENNSTYRRSLVQINTDSMGVWDRYLQIPSINIFCYAEPMHKCGSIMPAQTVL